MSENTKISQNWQKLEAYRAAARAVGMIGVPMSCQALEETEQTTRNIGDIESKPYDLRESISHEECGQYMQGSQTKCEGRRAAVSPDKTLEEIIDEVQQKLGKIEKDLTELDRNMGIIKEDLDRQDEEDHGNEAGDAYNSGEASIADTEDLEYDLSESDELCDFGAPVNETQPSLQALFSPAAVHAIRLEALNHQTYLLKEKLTERTNNIRTIYDLISTTLCMIEACTDPKSLRSADEHSLVSKISTNIEESQAAFGILRLQENCILSASMRQLPVAFSALLDSLFENARQHDSSGSVSEHSRTAGAKAYHTGQQQFPVTEAQVMTSDEDYPPPLPQSPTKGFNSPSYYGEECEGGSLAPTGSAVEMYEPQKILLPRGFTIRSLDPRHPNLSFPDPSMAIHFQEDATREYIQDVLRSEYEAYERCGISRYKANCWDFEREQRIWLMEAIEIWLIHCERIENCREAWNHFKFGKGRTVLMSGNNAIETPHGEEIRIRGWESRLEEGHCLVGTCHDGSYADDFSMACKGDDVLPLAQSSLKKKEGFKKNDEKQQQHGWSDEKQESLLNQNIEGRTIYRSIKLPRGFTIPSRSPYQASLTFLDEPVCLDIPYDTDDYTKKLILDRERRYDPECIIFFEGDQRVWLTDAINVWWRSFGHSARRLKEWEDFGKNSGCLIVVSNNNFILRPCGNIRVDRSSLGDRGSHEFYESTNAPPIPIRHPEFYHVQRVLRQFSPSTVSANPETEKPMAYVPCTVTFLPAGFTLPSYGPHQGNLVFRNATYAYNFPLGGTTSNDFYRVLQEEIDPAEYTILTVRLLQQKQQLKDNVLAWWAIMPLELKDFEAWPGFEEGDTYIITDQYSVDRQVYENVDGSHIRGGGADPEIHIPVKDETFEYRNFEDGFEGVHGELLEQNTGACGDSLPSPCSEACVNLTKLLQMRNSYLEREVKELHDTNNIICKDVQWHVCALVKLETDLKEAQIERATALAKAQDLNVQVALLKKFQMLPATASNDRNSTYADLVSSASDTSSVGCSTDITTKCTHGSRQHDCRQTRPGTGGNSSLRSPIARQHTPTSYAATSFYFFPQTSLILLMRSPPLLYQWPSNTTLSQIHRELIHRHNNGVKDDNILEIMDILDIREILDIHLPDPMRDEVIKISIPDSGNMYSPEKNTPVTARETFDLDVDLNNRDWKGWWGDVAQPEPPCLHSPAYSDRSLYTDANEYFRDWPWDSDAAGEIQCQDEQTLFPESRGHPLCCSNTYPSLRGGRGDDFDKPCPSEPNDTALLYDSKSRLTRYHSKTEHMFLKPIDFVLPASPLSST